MQEIREIGSALSKITSYACNIKTKQSNHFLIVNHKDEMLSWYKSNNQEPFIIETKDEIVRLIKSDILSIGYQPISELRSMIGPLLYALTSPQSNLVKQFLISLVFVAAGIFGWTALKGQSLTVPDFVIWFKSWSSLIFSAFVLNFLVIGFLMALKASGQLARTYWEKPNLLNSLASQALMIGVLSIVLPQLVLLFAINLK